jgi:hypothetical protein
LLRQRPHQKALDTPSANRCDNTLYAGMGRINGREKAIGIEFSSHICLPYLTLGDVEGFRLRFRSHRA